MSDFAPLLVVLIIFIAFVVMFVRARWPRLDVDGRPALYDEPCSVLVRMPLGLQMGSNFSLSRVKLFSERLVVAGAVNLEIPLDQIVSIELGRRWFSEGVRVRSTNDRWREVFLYVRRPKDLIELVERQRSARGGAGQVSSQNVKS